RARGGVEAAKRARAAFGAGGHVHRGHQRRVLRASGPALVAGGVRRPAVRNQHLRIHLQPGEGPRDLAIELLRDRLGASARAPLQADAFGLSHLPDPLVLQRGEEDEDDEKGRHRDHEREAWDAQALEHGSAETSTPKRENPYENGEFYLL